MQKQQLEGEFSKLRFSVASTNQEVKAKKQSLEYNMNDIEAKINKIRTNIREIKH